MCGLLAILTVGVMLVSTPKTNSESSLLLQNIEALAQGSPEATDGYEKKTEVTEAKTVYRSTSDPNIDEYCTADVKETSCEGKGKVACTAGQTISNARDCYLVTVPSEEE